jgi:hypothetical protein
MLGLRVYSYYVCDSTDDIRVVAIGYYPKSRSSSESDSRKVIAGDGGTAAATAAATADTTTRALDN